MSANKSASLEAKLKNSKDLVGTIKEYSLYSPTSDDIKATGYEQFVNRVDGEMVPYNRAIGELKAVQIENSELFTKLNKIALNILSEISEVKGKDSQEYVQVNSIVKTITGRNVTEHSKVKKDTLKELKEGENPPSFSSVSALDFKSRLGNFRALSGLIKSFAFYNPSDPELTIAALDEFEAQLESSLANVNSKITNITNERSKMKQYFADKGGLTDRARRAKQHVKRKYGLHSPEYKAISNRRY